MAMKEINLFLGNMNRRDYPKVEQIVSDLFTIVDVSDVEDIRAIADKIQFAIYLKLDELVSVNITPDHDGYDISINELDPKQFNFNTWGNY